MKSLFLLCKFLLFSVLATAANLHGTVTDEAGEPLPFVTVYVEGTTQGTTTNLEGKYQLVLEAGMHRVGFRYVGMGAKYHTVELKKGETKELNVQLSEQAVQLREVEVSSKYDDPAYWMIKKVQKRRRFYLNQVEAFRASAYIKGVQYVYNVPESFMGEEIDIEGLDENRSGIIYLSESISDVFFEAPSSFREVMISSKVSGQSKAYSWNTAQAFGISFYENNLDIGIGERGFVSPIAGSAFLFYKYKYIGDFQENGVTVNKIKVIPRSKGAPLFSGYVYVQDDSWRLHGVDLYLTKDSGIEFIDSLRVKQEFIKVNEDVWLPGTHLYELSFKVPFIKTTGDGSYMGVFSDYRLGDYKKLDKNADEDEEALAAEENSPQPLPLKRKKNRLNPKEALDSLRNMGLKKNEVMRVQEGSNKKDSVYWAKMRPVPLTLDEQRDYVLKDSIEVLQTSKVYLDSIDKKSNRFKFSNLIFGYTRTDRYRNLTWGYNALPEMLSANTVEGLVLQPSITLRHTPDSADFAQGASLDLRYGFSREVLNYRVNFWRRFNSKNRFSLGLAGGRMVEQYNPGAIPRLWNTVYTVFLEENYWKAYETYFASLRSSINVNRWLHVRSSLRWEERHALQNAESLPRWFIDRNDKTFTSNNPEQPENDAPAFTSHQSLQLTGVFTIRPGRKIWSTPERTSYTSSNWPTFRAAFRYAAPITEAAPSFLQLHGNVKINTLDFGLLGSSEMEVTGGVFIDDSEMYFMDYRHFSTTQTIFAPQNEGAFRLLPYYEFSARSRYATVHYTHHFNGFIFNKLPLLRKLKWQVAVAGHALFSPEVGNYQEFSVGLEHILKVGRIEFVRAWRQGKRFSDGIRLSFGF